MMNSWHDYIQNRFADHSRFKIVVEPLGYTIQSADPANATRLRLLVGPEGHSVSASCWPEGRGYGGLPELADQLGFTAQNTDSLDSDLTAVVENGWTERHYFLLASGPYKRVTYLRGARGTTYYESCLGAIVDRLTMGLLSLAARKKEIQFQGLG